MPTRPGSKGLSTIGSAAPGIECFACSSSDSAAVVHTKYLTNRVGLGMVIGNT